MRQQLFGVQRAPTHSQVRVGTRSLLTVLALALPVQIGSAQETGAQVDDHFPISSALEQGVSPDGLARLSELVQGFVDEGEIVGAELLVIKKGKSILHEAFGMRDREADEAMQTGSVFCVRSMTKPLIGTSILMLVDEDKLELDDRVSVYLPSFDVDGLREITIEHLLTHTSGLPMSQIMTADQDELLEQGGIMAVANLSKPEQLKFAVGTNFNYSDQGTDTLTAIIEVVTGETPAKFVQERVLDPLGMHDTTCVMDEGHRLRDRGCSKYVGSRNAWTNFWDTSKPPLFPFFLGSQGLYSTLTDYAKFLEFWDDKGRVDGERLLAARYVRKALKPGPFVTGHGTSFPGLDLDYGFLMQLWTGPGESADREEREVVIFGHTGSDGTHAWAFPEQDAMVLYFTQSRNNTTGRRVEELLGDLLLGVPFDANQAAPPFDDYLGYYREDADDMYRAIVRDGDDLALEILARAIVPLSYIGDDRWKLRPDPSKILEFDRSESGEVTGFHIGDHYEYRFEPSDHLPASDELAAHVAKRHRIDLLETIGALRLNSELSIPKLNMSGETSTLVAWPDRFLIETEIGGQVENTACDGETLWYSATSSPLAVLDGPRADDVRAGSIVVRFGDWRHSHSTMEVVQEIPGGPNERVYLVRMGDTSAPAATYYVDVSTQRMVGEDRMTNLPGMGRIGWRARYSDFRDVGGMLLPFKSQTQIANPMIGEIEVIITDFELGVDAPPSTFKLTE